TFNVGGHSHGGNEANLFSQIYDGKKIDNLITIGTPVRYDYMPNYENIENHYNAYSNLDLVQISGGTIPTSAFAGAVAGGVTGSLFGPAGTLFGATTGFIAGVQLGWGEAGPAGRTYNNATNINVTWQSRFGPINSHTEMPNTSVWAKINKTINGK
ncbi:MAG: hypothetical protein HYS02_01925, partial [Candidatus Staskawiczbacteria bacterium]|nr:hypothetical protein [Candidatus Staskawiczbacteria bacterium]